MARAWRIVTRLKQSVFASEYIYLGSSICRMKNYFGTDIQNCLKCFMCVMPLYDMQEVLPVNCIVSSISLEFVFAPACFSIRNRVKF
jgi:hypothetical protein